MGADTTNNSSGHILIRKPSSKNPSVFYAQVKQKEEANGDIPSQPSLICSW